MTNMEEAPPPPPPPPVEETPRLFMTPHLSKRKDGLCPSLYHHQSSAKPVKDKPGQISRPYQTNSGLLLQVKAKDSVPREVIELQTLVDRVNTALKDAVKNEDGVTALRFKPEGCVWKMNFEDEVAALSYRMEVICKANEGPGVTVYVMECLMIPLVPIDPDPLAPPVKGYKEAKAVFDKISLDVRKAVVRLEFPEFPEGCKGTPFRDVYQLNARVSNDCTRVISFN